MKRVILTFATVGVVAAAMALSSFARVFAEKYNVKDGSNLAKAQCAVCHVGPKGGKLNPYGSDVKAALKADNAKKLTAAILGKVENLDSTKSGKKNIDKIKADQNPGK